MNVNYDTSLKGEYTIYDENMNVLCETNNLITDWGMRRFVGDRSEGAPHPADTDESQQAFVNNMKIIMLGTDATPASTTDFQLISAIPTTEYTTTNEATTTGTLLTTDPFDGDLLMVFTRMTRFQMAEFFNTNLAPLSTYSINEIGCNWSNTVEANNRYGIFSRATLPSPVTVKPTNVIFAKYKLTIKTNANQVLNNMYRVNGTGANSLPNNKTNIRSLPLYTLQNNGEPSNILNNGIANRQTENIQPLFEDIMQHNYTYTATGVAGTNRLKSGTGQDNTFGTAKTSTQAKKLWWLQMYTSEWIGIGDDPMSRYTSFTSSTTANMNNSSSIDISRSSVNSGFSTYGDVQQSNLSLFTSNPTYTGRKNAENTKNSKVGDNQWNIVINFLFTPNQQKDNITMYKIYPSTLGDWDRDCVYCVNSTCSTGTPGGLVYVDTSGSLSYGVITVFDAPYTPNQSNFEGFEYNFNFSRN